MIVSVSENNKTPTTKIQWILFWRESTISKTISHSFSHYSLIHSSEYKYLAGRNNAAMTFYSISEICFVFSQNNASKPPKDRLWTRSPWLGCSVGASDRKPGVLVPLLLGVITSQRGEGAEGVSQVSPASTSFELRTCFLTLEKFSLHSERGWCALLTNKKTMTVSSWYFVRTYTMCSTNRRTTVPH